VEKSCIAKGIKRKKAKEKYFIVANKYALPPNIQCMHCNVWMFAMFTNWQCLFCRQNANGNGLAGAIVPPVRSLAETK